MKSQMNFFDYHNLQPAKKRYGRTIHGGCETKGHRKLERPLSTSRPLHLILKSEKARGKLSMLSARNKIFIDQTLREKAKKFGVKIHEFVNVGNHLHIKISIQSREYFQKFLKSVSALIARHVTGARKGQRFGKFWQGLAFTRILTSSLEELYLRGYFQGNRIESGGRLAKVRRVSGLSRTGGVSRVRGMRGRDTPAVDIAYLNREEFLTKFRGWVYRERLQTKYLRFREQG